MDVANPILIHFDLGCIADQSMQYVLLKESDHRNMVSFWCSASESHRFQIPDSQAVSGSGGADDRRR